MPSPQNSLGDLAQFKRGPKNPARYLRGMTLNNGVSATSVSEVDWIESAFIVRLFTSNSYFRT